MAGKQENTLKSTTFGEFHKFCKVCNRMLNLICNNKKSNYAYKTAYTYSFYVPLKAH